LKQYDELIKSPDIKNIFLSPKQYGSHSASIRRRKGIKASLRPFNLSITTVREPNLKEKEVAEVNVTILGSEKQLCVIWGFPCHPTSGIAHTDTSAEYIGFVRKRLRQIYGMHTVVHFHQGASGDIRQPFYSRNPSKIGIMKFLLRVVPSLQPSYCIPTSKSFESWSTELADTVCDLVSIALQSEPEKLSLRKKSVTVPSGELFEPEHPVKQCEITTLELSDGNRYLAINSEVTKKLGKAILNKLDDEATIISCVNESLGYMSTEEEFGVGGYEATEWAESFGLVCQPRKMLEHVLVNKLESLNS